LIAKELNVYGVELQFVAWTTDILEEVSQWPVSHLRELLDQLGRACTVGISCTSTRNNSFLQQAI
jgi:hypothetical protein